MKRYWIIIVAISLIIAVLGFGFIAATITGAARTPFFISFGSAIVLALFGVGIFYKLKRRT